MPCFLFVFFFFVFSLIQHRINPLSTCLGQVEFMPGQIISDRLEKYPDELFLFFIHENTC